MNEEEAKLKTTLLQLRAGRKGTGDDLHPEQLLPDMLTPYRQHRSRT